MKALEALRAKNSEAPRALGARNNEVVKREDNERRVKRKKKLRMSKGNDCKKERLEILLVLKLSPRFS